MPQPLRDDLERLAGRQRGGGVAVADAVQGDRRQAGVADQPGEPLGDVLGVENLAVLASEDQAGVDPGRSQARRSWSCRTRWALRAAAVKGSRASCRRLVAVLASAATTGCLSTTTTPDANRTGHAPWRAVSHRLRRPPARDAGRLVELAQAEGWEVCVIATPSGRSFIDQAALEAATGHPVRSEYKQPEEPDVLPPPDAIVVAPATFNTINKWAAGISDIWHLGC
jgi:hypothetical protein